MRKVKLPLLPQRCPYCEQPSPWGATHFACQPKLGLAGVFCFFDYFGPAGKMIRQLKYQLAVEVADQLVTWVATVLPQIKPICSFWQKNNFLLLPLPSFPARLFWRGFEQNKILTNKIAKLLGLPIQLDGLRCVRWRRPQQGLDAKKRKMNVRQSFLVVKPRWTKGKNFLIFDDVWTTGATLKEAGTTLKRAGANLVWGLTLTR